MKEKLTTFLLLSVFSALTCIIYAEDSDSNQGKPPTRTETRKVNNVSTIDIDHKYGHVTIVESASKDINIEVQYFYEKEGQAIANITTEGSTLKIETEYENKSMGKRPKINYIISASSNMNFSFDQKYGNITFSDFKKALSGKISVELAYGKLDIKPDVSDNLLIDAKYSDIQLAKTQNASILAKYSNFTIAESNTIELEAKYSNFKIGKLESLESKGSLAYSNLDIKSISSCRISEFKYSDLSIANLLKSLITPASYSKINIAQVGPKVETISIDGRYSTINLSLSPELSTKFNASLSYGALRISSAHNIKYTEDISSNNRVKKSGTIGKNAPTANITVSNTYADISIK